MDSQIPLQGMKKNQTRKYPENRLPHFMDKCKMSKEDIADALGVDKESVRRWITGETDLTHGKMIALAGLFGCDVYELIVSKEDILNKELAYLNEQREFFNAYKAADQRHRDIVDSALGMNIKKPPDTPARKPTTPSVPTGKGAGRKAS